MIVTRLTNKDTIEAWRAAKRSADSGNDLHAILGCVGKPIADLLSEAKMDDKETLEACEKARANLLEYVNDACERAVDQAVGEVHDIVEYAEVSDEIDFDGSMSLGDIVDAARDEIASLVANTYIHPLRFTDDEL